MSTSDRKTRLLEVVRQQYKLVDNQTGNTMPCFLPQWRVQTQRKLTGLLVPEEVKALDAFDTGDAISDTIRMYEFLKALAEEIEVNPGQYLVNAPSAATESTRGVDSASSGYSRAVFVVHGHDTLAKTEVARVLEQLRLQPIVLHEQPNEGRTLIEKFELQAGKVSFAVILLSPDDQGFPAGKPMDVRPRARQNVILELGYFAGMLGRGHVCVLYKGDVEIPSDYLGVLYTPMDSAGAWKFSLAKELRQSGLEVDVNGIL